MSVVNAGIAKLRTLGAANLVMAQLEGGVGTLYMGTGDYQAALECRREGVSDGH